jgi:hypothetical protein
MPHHASLQVHPLTGERAIMLGYFVRGLLGVSSADSSHLFAMLRDHVTRLENTVRWRWSAGGVVIWDNCATQHKAIDDYGDQPRRGLLPPRPDDHHASHLDTSQRRTAWLGISDSNFDVQREYSSL